MKIVRIWCDACKSEARVTVKPYDREVTHCPCCGSKDKLVVESIRYA